MKFLIVKYDIGKINSFSLFSCALNDDIFDFRCQNFISRQKAHQQKYHSQGLHLAIIDASLSCTGLQERLEGNGKGHENV